VTVSPIARVPVKVCAAFTEIDANVKMQIAQMQETARAAVVAGVTSLTTRENLLPEE
jgi:hypothetical protein